MLCMYARTSCSLSNNSLDNQTEYKRWKIYLFRTRKLKHYKKGGCLNIYKWILLIWSILVTLAQMMTLIPPLSNIAGRWGTVVIVLYCIRLHVWMAIRGNKRNISRAHCHREQVWHKIWYIVLGSDMKYVMLCYVQIIQWNMLYCVMFW